MGKRHVGAQDAPAGGGRRHGDAALRRENDHELEHIESARCGSRGSDAWLDWRPCHDFGTTRTGTVEQRCIQERTRRHVVRAGHPSKLRHQRSNWSAVQLAGDVSPRRNDQREHEQPGFCDRAARRRSGALARCRSPYLQPADGRPDQLRYASEPADVSRVFRGLVDCLAYARAHRRRPRDVVRHQRVLQGRWHALSQRLLHSGSCAVRIVTSLQGRGQMGREGRSFRPRSFLFCWRLTVRSIRKAQIVWFADVAAAGGSLSGSRIQ